MPTDIFTSTVSGREFQNVQDGTKRDASALHFRRYTPLLPPHLLPLHSKKALIRVSEIHAQITVCIWHLYQPRWRLHLLTYRV